MASDEVLFALIKTKCLPVLLYGTEISPLNSAINHSLQFILNEVFFYIVWLHVQRMLHRNRYFGIGLIEEIVRKRRDKFINSYGASDNCLCQLLYREG